MHVLVGDLLETELPLQHRQHSSLFVLPVVIDPLCLDRFELFRLCLFLPQQLQERELRFLLLHDLVFVNDFRLLNDFFQLFFTGLGLFLCDLR